MNAASGQHSGRWRRFVATLPAAVIFIGVIGYGTLELLHSQALSLGEHWYPKYHELRYDPDEPSCDPAQFAFAGGERASADRDESPDDLLDDLVDPAPEQRSADTDDDLLDDLVDDAPDAEDGEVEGDLLDDLGDEDLGQGSDEDSDDLLDDLEDSKTSARKAKRRSPSISREAAEAARKACAAKHDKYAEISGRITPGVRTYRAIEKGIASAVVFAVEHFRHLLVILILLCAGVATATRCHIAIRTPRGLLESRISQAAQLCANAMLMLSAWAKHQVNEASGVLSEDSTLAYLWMVGFGVLCLMNLWHLRRPDPTLSSTGGVGRGLLCVPLYTTMALISGPYFVLGEGYGAGLATYIGRLPEHAVMYIHVGLYVWAGMLLKQTKLATLLFDVLRPWRLAPEMLAVVVVLLAAIPTAFSGASGIFVIAVGAVIYEELRRAGARRQLALAATAMSGSLGVVLRPCLLVVIIASLNQEVTTDELFRWGWRVFLLTGFLFLVGALVTKQSKLTLAPIGEALPASRRALGPILPYLLIFVLTALFFAGALDAYLDEHSAPVLLPILLLAMLAWDRRQDAQSNGTWRAVTEATDEATSHIGALLLLMGLSVCLGGIIERADLMALFPADFDSIWAAMTLLVATLVIIGMCMDPYGAVILVSSTIALVAYRNGIDPVHFWMVVLVAFELGYLSPPVALNHLLTRQVVGADEADAALSEGDTFWYRHERILLPVTVMAVALIIVAFVPLSMYG